MFATITLFCALIYSIFGRSTDEELIKILTTNITADGSQIDDETMLEYIYGNQSDATDPSTIDTVLLEAGNIKDIVAVATRKHIQERNRHEAYYGRGPRYADICMDLMKQSVYGTRYRLQATKGYRKKYSTNPIYQMGMYYGCLMQLRLKMDSLINTLYKFSQEIKFLWHLVVYERILMINVDVESMVARLFSIHKAAKADDDQEAELYDHGTTAKVEERHVFLPG